MMNISSEEAEYRMPRSATLRQAPGFEHERSFQVGTLHDVEVLEVAEPRGSQNSSTCLVRLPESSTLVDPAVDKVPPSYQ